MHDEIHRTNCRFNTGFREKIINHSQYTRAKEKGTLNIPQCKFEWLKKQTQYNGIIAYNGIPENIKNHNTKYNFKNKIRHWIAKNY